ncbi:MULTISPECIES: hypothetical protein [unclassified Streptomyces]|uniref:hypothetical protein n=1 Tax=unclassified Streptomyces TaxID=2593676 RepID=UPI002E7A8F36|nr:hypothetical protein [Streptomyces sp. JV176]MEE1804033.1 hypothetical protein [Streptomyces sp. JV176]
MSEPNPYADGEYTWGPAQQPGPGIPAAGKPGPYTPGTPQYDFPPPTLADGQSLAPPGYGFPPPQGYSPAPTIGPGPGGGAPLLAIGDITVTGDSIITPSGTMPLKGAVWNATDMSRTEEKIPTHAIVLAVVFGLLCLVGLFFLLMKEKRTTGFIQVMVSSGGRHHSTMIPAMGPESFQMVMGQINYARSLSNM